MAITIGTFLKHSAFGLCRVTRLDSANIYVLLPSGREGILLRARAEQTCQEVPAAAIDQASPLRVLVKPVRSAPRSRSVGPGRSRPCAHCQSPLKQSMYSADRRLKSCPRCSEADEKTNQHVFHDYPAEFGTSDPRASAPIPDGAQSHCNRCRRYMAPRRGKACGLVMQ